MKRILFTLVMGLAMTAPGALAGAASGKNPVVDLSGRINPGLWESTTVMTLNGKARKPRKSNDCITAADLRDFLNQKGTPPIEEYSLHGNHIYVKMVGKTPPMMLKEDVYIDTPDRMHATLLVVTTLPNQQTVTTKARVTSRRVSANCAQEGAD